MRTFRVHGTQGREGGWWAGVLGAVLGILGTGITADTPVGTRLFSWLVWSSLVTFLATIMTLLALDGRRWLDTKVGLCLDRLLLSR